MSADLRGIRPKENTVLTALVSCLLSQAYLWNTNCNSTQTYEVVNNGQEPTEGLQDTLQRLRTQNSSWHKGLIFVPFCSNVFLNYFGINRKLNQLVGAKKSNLILSAWRIDSSWKSTGICWAWQLRRSGGIPSYTQWVTFGFWEKWGKFVFFLVRFC